MKIKIFSNDNPETLEKQVNAWFDGIRAGDKIKVLQIIQSESPGGTTDKGVVQRRSITLTVFYQQG